MSENAANYRPPALQSLMAKGALLATMLLLAACATTPKSEPVVQRAEERWEALINGDLEKAYSYYSPGFRSSTSVFDYGVAMRSRPVRWTAVSYKDHNCEGDRCIVRFDIEFRVLRPAPGLDVYNGKDVVEDTWIRSRGQWWYLPVK